MDGRFINVPDTPPQGKSHQGVSKLLLLAMFAFAARYSRRDAESPAHTDARPEGRISKAGNVYAVGARNVLSEILLTLSVDLDISCDSQIGCIRTAGRQPVRLSFLWGSENLALVCLDLEYKRRKLTQNLHTGSMEQAWIYTGMYNIALFRIYIDL